MGTEENKRRAVAGSRKSSDSGSLIGRRTLEDVESLRWACEKMLNPSPDSVTGRQTRELVQAVDGQQCGVSPQAQRHQRSCDSTACEQNLEPKGLLGGQVHLLGGQGTQQPMQARESVASIAGQQTLDLAATPVSYTHLTLPTILLV